MAIVALIYPTFARMTATEATRLLRTRRSIFPATYTDRPIERAVLEEILENANYAPTHRLTEPWRFKVFRGAGKDVLEQQLVANYATVTPAEQRSEKKVSKMRGKLDRSDTVIALCMQRDPKARVPEWEEIAATAMAVQNLWLSCHAHGIGCYWSSPAAALHGGPAFRLAAGERCLGLLYMGYHELPDLPAKRGPVADKITWVE